LSNRPFPALFNPISLRLLDHLRKFDYCKGIKRVLRFFLKRRIMF